MAEDSEELIRAQNQVIGILFEVVKRLQANNDLDEEYLQIIAAETKSEKDMQRLDDVLRERKENAEVAGRLLGQLEG